MEIIVMLAYYAQWILGYLCLLVLSLLWSPAITANVPCSPRAGDEGQGQICVCNSTYCDTIERPIRLPLGQYYLYTTSNSTPGFSQTNGTFSADGVMDNDDVVFTVNSTVEFQEILGVGGSFTDSVGIILNSLAEDVRAKVIESYFGPTGIEYALGRVPIGGSDFSTHMYTLDDVPYDYDFKHFNITEEDYTLKIPYIKKAMNTSARGVKLYGCAWNSPSWMKGDNSAQPDYILSEYLHYWAKYHVKFLQAYKDNGLNFWAVSGGNEVMFLFTYKRLVGVFMGLLATAPTQRRYLKEDFFPLLKAANLSDVKFLVLDDMRTFSEYFLNRMAEDPEAYQHLGGVALHWYADWHTSPYILDRLHKSHPDKLIVYTESSINYFQFADKTVELGCWERAEAYMYNIMENFNHFPNAYIDWNLILNTDGGPTISIPLDAAVIVNQTSGEFYKQPMFYGLGHFSKFIPPGSKRVEVKSNQRQSSCRHSQHSEVYNQLRQQDHEPNNNVASSLFTKYSAGMFRLRSHIKVPPVVFCLATANSDDSHTVIVLNSNNMTVRVRIENPKVGSVAMDFEAHSINTFVYWLQ